MVCEMVTSAPARSAQDAAPLLEGGQDHASCGFGPMGGARGHTGPPARDGHYLRLA
eukprot:SAG11_NODE_2429_length_3371_cov_5.133863_6_plen_56_part_00